MACKYDTDQPKHQMTGGRLDLGEAGGDDRIAPFCSRTRSQPAPFPFDPFSAPLRTLLPTELISRWLVFPIPYESAPDSDWFSFSITDRYEEVQNPTKIKLIRV